MDASLSTRALSTGRLLRPAPMSAWQLDFKDVSSVPAAPEGKRQHVVETLDVIDMGTSVLLDAQVHDTFTAETALAGLAQTLQTYGLPAQLTLDRDPRWVGSPHGSDFPSALLRFGACLGIHIQVCDPHHPQQNAFVERYHRTYNQECLALERPGTLEEARTVTETFVQHYNFQRPNQALSCGNRPPRTAFATLPPLPTLPSTVDPDGWLTALDGLHLVRKVDSHGMVSVDLKRYYVSSQLVGHQVVLHLDSADRCLQVLFEQHPIKLLPLKGLVGHRLSYEQFLLHMLHQARAQTRLRSLQERKWRTASFADP
jgi:Integrase core domain